MSARDKLSQQEQWLAYLIGAGITLIIVGFVLNGLGTIDDSNITTSLILIGLALLVIGAGAWLILLRPWTQFDDLTTPHYTGHHAADHAEDHAEDHAAEPEAVAETVAAVVEPAPEPVVAAVA
ncbi:MAG: hypothetical protein JXQ72_15395, partial [Anaerolineae bacterium]|nr:hypothetical protein [Anaerolineae bacterium]